VIDKLNTTLYFHAIVWRINKAGHFDPLRFRAEVCTSCNVLTAKPDLIPLGTSMAAIKLYRRFSLRRTLYFLLTTQPIELLRAVRLLGRGPPISQTQHGFIAFT